MARKKEFLGAAFSDRFRESYHRLTHEQQKGTDRVILALMKQDVTPGMRVKPIHPAKFYQEARINDGDRLVFRIENGIVWIVDVVPHDDIGRYGTKAAGLFGPRH